MGRSLKVLNVQIMGTSLFLPNAGVSIYNRCNLTLARILAHAPQVEPEP